MLAQVTSRPAERAPKAIARNKRMPKRNLRQILGSAASPVPKRGRPLKQLPAAAPEPPPPLPELEETRQAPVLDEDTSALTPLSPSGIRLGRTLNDPFSATDLRARLDCNGDSNLPHNWLYAWGKKDWVERAGYGIYRKTEKFGQ